MEQVSHAMAECPPTDVAVHTIGHGMTVIHLVDLNHQLPHRLNPLARRQEGRLIYDRGATEQLGLEL